MRYLPLCLLVQVCATFGQDTYRAAVVEYAPKLTADTPNNRVLENVEEFVNYIDEAAEKQVDVILFPEYGLTGIDVNSQTLDEISTEVPNPSSLISPCTNPQNYSKALIDISCAARTHSIYVVFNLLERVLQDNSSIYHNTNVAINRDGIVVSRCRKMNLYNETFVEAGNTTATFKSDFGVTFGVIICNDILFQNSSLSMLEDSVTDVLFSTAWSMQLPFFGGLTIQHGYAVANGLNLLASGYDNPSSSKGGSGIYLANGTVADAYISGTKSSKMLIADVPKIRKRIPTDVCQNAVGKQDKVSSRFGIGGVMPDISEFKTLKEDMSNFTLLTLNLNQKQINQSACSNEQTCCHINITLSKTNDNIKYVYKLAVFNGGRYLLNESIGARVCALVACANDSSASCGETRTGLSSDAVFETISLKATFKKQKSVQDRPATLNYKLEPISNYTYCKTVTNETDVEITMLTEHQTNLLTFGVYGRVFENDNKGTGVFNNASFHIVHTYVAFIVSIVVFFLQD